MEKVIFRSQTIDSDGVIINENRVFKKEVKSKEQFVQTYIRDVGVLLQCTKGQIDLLICIMKNQFIEFDTNEVILNSVRRKLLSECSGIKVSSIYSLFVGLKSKKVIVTDDKGKDYLNPNLFFFGSELARDRMFSLKINYTIVDDIPVGME